MITISDNDLPITVAEKIIRGTKVEELSPAMKSLRKAITGNEDDEGEEKESYQITFADVPYVLEMRRKDVGNGKVN